MSVIPPSQPAQSGLPDRMVSVREVFGIDTSLRVPAFSQADAHVPEIDSVYRFNPEVTLALLALTVATGAVLELADGRDRAAAGGQKRGGQQGRCNRDSCPDAHGNVLEGRMDERCGRGADLTFVKATDEPHRIRAFEYRHRRLP